MITVYEKYFNSPDSDVNVDATWIRAEAGDHRMGERYNYALSYLYGHVLELGAGDGYFAFLASRQDKVNHVTAVEVQDKALERIRYNLSSRPMAEGKITVYKGVIEDLVLNTRFDTVHCGHTLEHVIDLEKSLKAIQAIRAEIYIISVPLGGRVSKQHLRVFPSSKKFMQLISDYFTILESKKIPVGGGRESLTVVLKTRA